MKNGIFIFILKRFWFCHFVRAIFICLIPARAGCISITGIHMEMEMGILTIVM
jgi:hypothetical protein